MSVAFRAEAHASNNGTATNGTIPAGAVVGDVLIMAISAASTSGWVDPAGWTKFDAQTDTSYDSRVYWRVCQIGDAGATAAVTVSGSAVGWAQSVTAWSGVNTLTPIHGVNQVAEGAVAVLTHTTPSLVTTKTAHILAILGDKQSTGAEVWTAPAGYTKQSEASRSGGGACSVAVGDKNGGDAAAGTYGNDAWTVGQLSAVASMFTVALLPGAPGSRNGSDVQAELNRLANNGTYRAPTAERDAQFAANEYAGTTGLDLVRALNVKAGNAIGAYKDLAGVANQLAGTTGLEVAGALRAIPA